MTPCSNSGREMALEGAARKLTVQAGGISRLRAKGLSCDEVDMDLSSHASVVAGFSKKTFFKMKENAMCSAFGDGRLDVLCSDAANFNHAEGLATEIFVLASGSSRVKVAFEGSGVIVASDHAEISYIQMPGASLRSERKHLTCKTEWLGEFRPRLGCVEGERQAQSLLGMSGKVSAQRTALLSMSADAPAIRKPPTSARR